MNSSPVLGEVPKAEGFNTNTMKRTTIILLLLTTLLQGTLAQTAGNGEAPRTSLDNIIIRSAIKQSLFPEERVYLHFDNTAYYLGESIWFKAYVMSGVDNEPTTISRVLYVELVSPEGYVVKTNKYRIEGDGSCHGSFELTPLLLSGYYEVRAYTRYMLNRGKDAIFSRVFPIFDKVNADNWDFKNMLDRRRGFLADIEENDSLTGLDRKVEWVNSELPSCDLDFYPEGGHLVNGIESTVAYEVFGNDGINSEQSITITADGKPLLTSTPEHLGKGTFTITPHKDVKYKAILKQGKKEKKFDLPDVENEGATINIIEENGTYYITTRNNLDGTTEMGCAIVHRGKVFFYERYLSTDTCMLFAIDSKTLDEGVNRVVLFVNDSIPLAERQFFVTHTEPQESDNATARLLVTSDGEEIEDLHVTPHGKITLDIEREDGKPISGSLFQALLRLNDAEALEIFDSQVDKFVKEHGKDQLLMEQISRNMRITNSHILTKSLDLLSVSSKKPITANYSEPFGCFVARYLIEVADPDYNLNERDCGTIKKERKRIAKIVKKKAEALKAEEKLWMQDIKYIDSKNIIYFKF